MLDRPGIAPLAARQLAAWEKIAEAWPLELEGDAHPWVWRCARCSKGVYLCTDSQGRGYHWSPGTRKQMITLHLRNHHLDLDPERCVP